MIFKFIKNLKYFMTRRRVIKYLRVNDLIFLENFSLDNIPENTTISQHIYFLLFKKYLNICINNHFLFYKNNKSLLNFNNKTIFLFIKEFLSDKEITNTNFHFYKNIIYDQLLSSITFDPNINKSFLMILLTIFIIPFIFVTLIHFDNNFLIINLLILLMIHLYKIF